MATGDIRERSFTSRVLIAVALVVATAGLITLFWFAFNLWLVLFAAILFSIFLRSLGNLVTRFLRIPQPWSMFLALAVLLGSATLGGWLLAKPIAEQFQELTTRLPEALDRARAQLEKFPLTRNFEMPSGKELSSASGQISTKILGIFRGTFEGIAAVVLIFFLGIYLALSPDLYLNGFVALFPKKKRSRIKEVLQELGGVLQHWLLGQLVAMTVVGILIMIGLSIVGVPLALVLGLIAGLLDFIPIFGPIVAAIPAALLGFTISPMHALYVVIVFVAANQIESHLLIPLVQKHTISLPPALTVFSLTLLGTLFGFLGLFLAMPLTATAVLLVKRLYIEDVLGDREDDSDSNQS